MWCYVWFHTVYLTLGSGPRITTDNTEILITDIGEDADDDGLPSLTCHSDLTACCRSNADNNDNGALGQWTFPDGSVILQNGGSATAGQQFYIIRNGPQLIKLARRESNNPLTPTGSYCCTVPTTGGDMTLCANLGEWSKLSLNLCFMSASMCSPFSWIQETITTLQNPLYQGRIKEIGHATEHFNSSKFERSHRIMSEKNFFFFTSFTFIRPLLIFHSCMPSIYIQSWLYQIITLVHAPYSCPLFW